MKKHTPYLIGLLLLSAGLIFYQFAKIPVFLAFDEVEFAQLATGLNDRPYVPFTAFADGHATLYFYIILAFFKLFGTTNFALRLPAALFSIASVFVLYKMFALVFTSDKKKTLIYAALPLLTAFIFATLRWNLNFSRFAFEMPFLLFLELTSIYFFFRYTKSKELWSLAASGVFSGLAFNSYQPGRFFFALILIGLALYSVKEKQKQFVKAFFAFLIPFAVLIAPMSVYLATHPQLDVRVNLQLYFKNTELSAQQKLAFLGENISKTALMFNVRGDGNGRHNYPFKPALNPIIGGLFAVGLLIALKNYKDFYKQFFLLYFALSLGPTLLTYPWENPNMLRTFTAIPSLVFFSGLTLVHVFKLLSKKLKPQFALAVICALLALSAFYDARTYFKYQAPVFRQAFEVRTPLPKAMDYIERPTYIRGK